MKRMKRMKRLFKFYVTLLFLLAICGIAFAGENALSDAYGNPSMLGEYNGETKRLSMSSSGALVVDSSGGGSPTTAISRKETAQALNSGALAYTTNFAAKTRIHQVYLHADSAISQTITIKINSKTGANYDTLLKSITLSSETDVAYNPENPIILESGDEIDLTCTNSGTPAVTIYATVLGETLA